jgi:uncharacterized membrane protein HdeD (DUF308 family)
MWLPSRHALVLRGLITMAFGLLLLVRPAVGLELLIFLFGTFALVDGFLVLAAALLSPTEDPARFAGLVAGSLAIAIGLVTFLWPGVTQFALLVLIAIRALALGTVEVATSVSLCRNSVGDRGLSWLLGSAGALSIAFAVLLLAFPGAALVALVRFIGLYAALVGLLLVLRAWVLTLTVESM